MSFVIIVTSDRKNASLGIINKNAQYHFKVVQPHCSSQRNRDQIRASVWTSETGYLCPYRYAEGGYGSCPPALTDGIAPFVTG